MSGPNNIRTKTLTGLSKSCLRPLNHSNITVFGEPDTSNQGTSLDSSLIVLQGGNAINAYAMTLHWTASSTSMTTATSTPESTSTVATTVAPSEVLNGGGLAGVIIGALIGSAIVVELLVWCLLSHRRQARSTGEYDKSDELYGIIGIIIRLGTRHRRQATAIKGHDDSIGAPVHMAPDNSIHEMADRGYSDVPELGA